MLRIKRWLQYATLSAAVQVAALPANAAPSAGELLEQAKKYVGEVRQEVDSMRKQWADVQEASRYATAADSASTLGCAREVYDQMQMVEERAQLAYSTYAEIVQATNYGKDIKPLDLETLREHHAGVHSFRNSIVSCGSQAAELSSTTQNQAATDVAEISAKSATKSSQQTFGTTAADVPASGVQAAMPAWINQLGNTL